MDLVADMLFDRLQREHTATIAPTLVRPAMRRRAARLPGAGKAPWVRGADRIANRLWDYPRIVSGLVDRFDLFHIVDHSYAQLVHRLPAGRTIVTCHDLDTFRSVLDPELEPRSAMFRAMTGHILGGLRKAGHIACDSHATRDALVAKAGIGTDRTTVVPNGPHPSCTPDAEPAADIDAARLARAQRGASSICCTSAARSRASESTCCCACSTRCARRTASSGSCEWAGRSPLHSRRSYASSGSATRSSSCRRSIDRRWRRSIVEARCC